MARKVPSLSSASTTSGPAPPHEALAPSPSIAAPTTNPGSRPAPASTVVSRADVVVLPCVPATATVVRPAHSAARAAARCTTGTPRR